MIVLTPLSIAVMTVIGLWRSHHAWRALRRGAANVLAAACFVAIAPRPPR